LTDISSRRSIDSGFSLVEVSVVLVIVGLLLAGLLLPLGAQIEQQNMNETNRRLEMAREALVGFAVTNRRMPCPASLSSSGVETTPSAVSPGLGTCSNALTGYVPAVTLGLQPIDSGTRLFLDAWGNPIRYAVTDFAITFTSTGGTTYTSLRPFTYTDGLRTVYNGHSNALLALAPDLRVCAMYAGTTSTHVPIVTSPSVLCGTTTTAEDNGLITNAVAVIFSTGKNTPTGGIGLDEAANLNGDRAFASHSPIPAGTSLAGGEFDDIVLWLSPFSLYNRMIVGGALP